MARASLPPDEPERYRPVSVRRRVLILVLAVATAIGIVLLMLDPALRLRRAQAERGPGPAPCAPGQQIDCVGGTSAVILLPSSPAPAASTVR
jgi:hypothetical protein